MASRVSFDTPIQSSDQSFDRVLNAGLPVAALFWSRAIPSDLEGEMNARAKADAGKLLVVKIKTEDNPELVKRYNIRTTPTLILFRDGRELTRVDYPSAAQFREHVEYLLGRGPEPKAPPRAETRQEPPPQAGAAGYQGTKSSASDGHPVVTTDAGFQADVVKSPVPVVVDLWAPWCGPCRMVAPILEKLASEYAGRLRIAKLNVDENPMTAQMYQVTGIPTLLFFKNGQMVNRVVGALPERQLRSAVDRFLTA